MKFTANYYNIKGSNALWIVSVGCIDGENMKAIAKNGDEDLFTRL